MENKPGKKRSSGELLVHCPGCRRKGQVPWDRLDRYLYCRNCAAWYRLTRTGVMQHVPDGPPEIQVEVRTHVSAWTKKRIPIASAKSWWLLLWGRAKQVPPHIWVGWCAGCAVLLLLAALTNWAPESPPSELAAALPKALDERARLLTDAWLKGDIGALLPLVEPARDRELRRWLARQPLPNPPPDLKTQPLQVAIRAQEQDRAVVVSSLKPPEGAGKPTHLLSTRWLRRGEHWYFVPSSSILPRLPAKQQSRARRS